MTNKNGKTVVNNVRDLGKAIEASKPDVSTLAGKLLEAFGQEYAQMDALKAHKANLVSLQGMYDEKAKLVPGHRKFLFETEKAIACAKSDAEIAIKSNTELTELRSYLKNNGKDADWVSTKNQIVWDEYVVPIVGQDKINSLTMLKQQIPGMVKELEGLKAAIENEKKAIAELS